jgi:hypothetical protein
MTLEHVFAAVPQVADYPKLYQIWAVRELTRKDCAWITCLGELLDFPNAQLHDPVYIHYADRRHKLWADVKTVVNVFKEEDLDPAFQLEDFGDCQNKNGTIPLSRSILDLILEETGNI